MIRKATVEDAPAIAKIHVHAWRAAYAGIVPADFLASMSEEKRTVSWREQLGDDRIIILVATDKSEMTGWVSAGPSRDADKKNESEIYAIYVSPGRWRQKVGRGLMESIEELLPDMADITLWVLQDNQRAIKFYENAGYYRDEIGKEIQIGGAKLSEIRLRKYRPNKVVDSTATRATGSQHD